MLQINFIIFVLKNLLLLDCNEDRREIEEEGYLISFLISPYSSKVDLYSTNRLIYKRKKVRKKKTEKGSDTEREVRKKV